MQGVFWTYNGEPEVYSSITADIVAQQKEYGTICVKVEKYSGLRSEMQNNSLHLYCRMVSDELNGRGITFTQFFNPGFEVPWSEWIVKDNVWRPVQKALTGNEKTSKAKTPDYSKVYDVVNNKLADIGFHVPWPSREGRNVRT